MELVVQVQDSPALSAALEAGAATVAVRLPRVPDPDWWAEAAAWQRQARQAGARFHLVWDILVREPELSRASETLAAAAGTQPDALVLRDVGLAREARRRFPALPLHAAGSLGLLNSPALRLAADLGFSRAVLEAPITLKDLALLRRQSSLPLEVVLPPWRRGYSHLCLAEDYLENDCAWCGGSLEQWNLADVLMESLEFLAGLCQLGVEAVRLKAERLAVQTLLRVLPLYQSVWEAPAAERPRVLAAARQLLAAFGPSLKSAQAKADAIPGEAPPKKSSRVRPSPPKPLPEVLRRVLWLEARGYPEAAALAKSWREPLLIQLTPENYAAFLPEHRRWQPRRIIWRLPPVLKESELSFYQKAMETLSQGGCRRLVAGDWGAVALARAAGAEVYGDQTLGIRNTWALEAARRLGVTRVCLPPGQPGGWQSWLTASPPGAFWAYLYQTPALAVCPRAAARPPAPPGWRWVAEGDYACLCRESPEHLEDAGIRLLRQGVAPLVVALPRSGLPWGRPPVLEYPRAPRRRPGP
jgi:hypothetical protein